MKGYPKFTFSDEEDDPKRNLKLLLSLVGNLCGLLGIVLEFLGLTQFVTRRDAAPFVLIAAGTVLQYVSHVHSRWKIRCKHEADFSYAKALKSYWPLWAILFVLMCIEGYIVFNASLTPKEESSSSYSSAVSPFADSQDLESSQLEAETEIK